jgi:hypothetical protein
VNKAGLRGKTAWEEHRPVPLQAEAAAARDAAAAAAADLGPWQAALAERDAELQNLQARPAPPVHANASAYRPRHRQGMHALRGADAEVVKPGRRAAAQHQNSQYKAVYILGFAARACCQSPAGRVHGLPLLLEEASCYKAGPRPRGPYAPQAALGELTFESEAAERLRGELRAAGRQLAEARGAADAAAAAAEAAEGGRREAEAALEAARAEAAHAASRQAAAAARARRCEPVIPCAGLIM